MKNLLQRYPDKVNKIASRIVDGEAVIVSPSEGIVTILNRVGSRIWELSDGERSVRDIASIIFNEFEAAPEEAIEDVQEFIADLSQKGLVKLNSGARNED